MAKSQSIQNAINWRRIVIEGGTIVVSILLAFAIDAAWEARKDRLEEQETLLALKGDFQAGAADAAVTLQWHEDLMQRFIEFQGMGPAELSALDSAQASEIAQSFAAPYTFDPRLGTLDAMLGSGRMGLIEDRQLQRQLITFLNQVDDSREDIAYMSNSAQQVWLDLVRFGGPWAQPGPREAIQTALLEVPDAAVLTAIHSDQRTMGLIRLHKRSSRRYVGELQRQIETIAAILESLDRVVDQP